jgi:hypothetical protein
MELSRTEIENRIFNIRGVQVMVDRDLSDLYQVDTKVLNQAVKRNINRFPEAFRFQLTKEEKMELVTNCDRLASLKHSSTHPYVFTEQGVAMLSAVLRSEVAIKASIQIMQAFVAMRKFMQHNASIFQRLDQVELKQLKTDEKLEQIFKALEAGKPEPRQGIFFDGQIFDAYRFAADLIRSAKKEIILIDNYVDDTVLTLLAKRNDNVRAIIYTKSISKGLQHDLDKFNSQYAPIHIQEFPHSHDRFLMIDRQELYLIGASLKDLGRKWFGFSKLNDFIPEMLAKLNLQ